MTATFPHSVRPGLQPAWRAGWLAVVLLGPTALCAQTAAPLPSPPPADEFVKIETPAAEPAFAIARREVTVGEWRVFAAESGHVTTAEKRGAMVVRRAGRWTRVENKNWRDPDYPQTDLHPVVGVSWHDAVAYAEWRTRRDHAAGTLASDENYSLPTEAQWERACRAGNFPGSRPLDEIAWHEGNSAGHAHPVGARPPSPAGLHDMLGNAWEWCLEPAAPEGTQRVLRGGSWANPETFSQPHVRITHTPDTAGSGLGLRLVIVRSRPQHSPP